MKKYIIAALILLATLASSNEASAHVTVKPNEVGVGAFQTFTISVPSEKELSTIELRLLLPEGLNYVTPTVKQGWYIRVKKEDTKNPDRVTEIAWFASTAGIPKGQRDEFSFSAQVPSTETSLQWKAHQIYVDGSVVSWDQSAADQPKDASGKADFTKAGPYSETKVINDVAPKPASSSKVEWANWISVVALIFSIISLAQSRKTVAHPGHHNTTS